MKVLSTITVTVAATPNALDPYSREITPVVVESGCTVRDLIPSGWGHDEGETLAFLGAMRCHDLDTKVKDGDLVHFFGGVTDPVTLVLIAIAVVSAVVSISMMPDIPTTAPAPNPDGSAAYGYYGFQNSFRAEGDPLPVVYGRMRVAPPVINQVISANGISQELSLSVREDLYCLLAISEGPILGLGIYEGVVDTDEDQDALVGTYGNAKKGTGLQINGIAATNFIGAIDWRTGTLNQEALIGSSGYINYTDASVIYEIGLTPTNGNINAIDDAAFPTGVFAAGSASLISNNQPTEFVEQDILSKVDRALVQITFAKGLYSQSGGGFQSLPKDIRVQYRETDSSGVGIGDYVLLPTYTVQSASTIPQVLDIPVSFVRPDTYVPSSQQGYHEGDSANRLENTTASGLSLIQPSNGTQSTQQWTMGFYFNCRTPVFGDAGANRFLFGLSTPVSNNVSLETFNYYNINPDSVTSAEAGFQLTMRVDVNGTIGASGRMYLELEMWMPGVIDRVGIYRADVGSNLQWVSGFRHIAIVFDGQSGGGSTTTVTAVIDGGLSYPMAFVENRGVGASALGQSSYWPYWSSSATQCSVGSLQSYSSTTTEYSSKQNLAEMFLYDGILDSGTLNLLGNSGLELDMFGNKISGVRNLLEGDPNAKILLPMDGYETDSGSNFYRNYGVNATGTVSEANGSLQLLGSASASKSTGGPVWSPSSGAAKKSYWQVEVYVSQQLSSNTQSNVATISSVTGLSSQPYAYPSTALASVNVEANEQVNNQQPQMTMLVKGRIVNTWDGSVDGEGNPALTPAWSRNPAWIAADLLTHPRYGLGAELTSDAIDWPSFLSWADFCDEGVPDAFGEVGFFGIRAEGNAVISSEQLVRFYIGLKDTAGGTANPEYTIPKSWRVKDPTTGASMSFVSLTELDSTYASLSDEWVTSDDIATGLNQASNQLGIYSIEYFEGPFHGYDSYAVVKARWNRLDGSGAAVWPEGISTGLEFFADDWGGGAKTIWGNVSGYESRCRFDGVFDQKNQGAWDAVLQIFTAGRAMPIKAGRKIIAIPDRPRPVVGVFGQGNIVTDTLELTYSGPKQRPNSVEGDILDEHSNYEKRTVLVDHPSVQDPTLFDSFRKERAEFRGVVRASQAMRDATYRLNRYHLVRRNAKFDVGPDAVNLLPGDRILVSHDVPQYGFSGRLRADMTIANTYPNGGSLYNSWDLQGGANALTQGALLSEDASAGTPVSASYSASLLRSLPTTSDATSLATSQGGDGSDFGGGGLRPGSVTQFVATSPQLYPPNPTLAPLAQIDDASYQCEFSVYVKEPALGAAEVVRLNVYRLVNASGTPIDTAYVADFTWSGGAITSTYTSTGIASSVTAIGSGWYRIGVVYSNATAGGAVGDYLQARIMMPTTSGGGVGAGSFDAVASGGKGINFLKNGDPLDCTSTDWTRYNDGTSSIDIDNVAFAPPFYTPTDGSYGQVVKLFKPGAIAFGTTPPNLVQTHTLTTGSGVANWDNETITLSGYARVGPLNGASNTSMYVSLRFANTVDSENKLNGDGVTATFTTSAGGSPWAAFGTPSKTEAAGTVNSVAHSVAVVRHNSSTNDANWVEWSVDVAYTPSAGTNTAVSVGVFTDSGGTASGGDTELYVWGLRLHGKSSNATKVSPYYHKQMLATSAMFQKGTGVGFQEGGTVKLDRDVTLEAGNSYELLLRSSFSPNAILNSDNSQVVEVDGSEVPASGSTTKAANADLKVMRPTQFTPHEGDLYSFGKSGKTSEDFVITRISLDPGTMHRTIECEEYNEAIYEDTGFGTTGTDTVSDLPSPEATATAIASMGVGSGSTEAALANRSNYIEVVDESQTDEGGNFVPMVEVRWQLPRGVRRPKEVRLYYQRETVAAAAVGDPPIYIGTVPANLGFFQYSNPILLRGKEYRFYVQPVGFSGSSAAVKASPSQKVTIRKAASPFAMAPPEITTVTRGWQQLYTLQRIAGTRTEDVVEGRIGGWKLGRPAFVIDPDIANTASDSTLVGQAATRLGVTEMQVFCRGRSGQGHYGQASVVRGSEQLTDVLFDHSTESSNAYPASGSMSVELVVSSTGAMQFDATSTALEAVYDPTSISLGSKPQRVLMNCVPEAFQRRPETLADLPYQLGGEKLRRWSFEGPMDDLDRGECELKVEWRWSSTASASSKDFREFRPGEVYARSIDFRITFIRPTADFDIRMERLIVQALLPPNYSPADVDGGTFA